MDEEPRLTIELDGVEGTDERRFFDGIITQYEIDSDYLLSTDGWSFTVYDDEDPGALRRKFHPLRGIKLYIDGNLQVVGRIDKISGAGDGSALNVSGRDYIADIVDGGADPALRFAAATDIGDAVLSVVQPFGIVTLLGGFNLTRNILTGKRPYFGPPGRDFKTAKLDEFKASAGMGAYELANKIVARHGYTIQPAGTDRSALVIAEPEFRQEPLYEIVRPGNLVLSATASRDYSSVPTCVVATGAGGKTGAKLARLRAEFGVFAADSPAAELVSTPEIQRSITSANNVLDVVEARRKPGKPDTTTYGTDWPLYRPMFYEDTESRNQEQLDRGARRMLAERLRSTLVYDCTVHGHTDPKSGATWAVDTIAMVRDAIEDVAEPMWIQQRTFSGGSSGPTTRLRLIRPGSYVL